MVTVQRLVRSRKVQIGFNVVFAVGLLAVTAVSAQHFLKAGWPLHHADPVLVGAAIALLLLAYAFKAFGWQRLFAEHERPAAGALAAAGGAACFGGIALPGRVDDALRVAVVRRYPGTRVGLGTVGLSLIVLGMLDNAALTPFASVAAADSSKWQVRVGFGVVALAGVAAALVVSFLPRLAAWRRLERFRAARWVTEHTHNTREAWAAWILISFSWALRGTAVFLLLNALALGRATYPVALAFLCASAASAALPIAPAGAATQAGAGAAILIASGVPKVEAVAFSVAVQAMVVLTGAAVVLLIGAWHLATRVRIRVRIGLARSRA
jgi:hypothetical protein